MNVSETRRVRKELKEQKEQHMKEMIEQLEKTRDFILVTDKFTAMSGTTQDVFKMINRMFGWLFDRTPKEMHLMYANYLEELIKEIRKK